MPTASTSQILGFNECIEPFTSNIYSRGTLAGQFFAVINKYLQSDLIKLGLWNDKLKDKIILANGSISELKDIPEIIRETYKISWDLSMKSLIEQAADEAYICQSQSLNLWMKNQTLKQIIINAFMHGASLKTGIYYLAEELQVKHRHCSIEVEKEPECAMCASISFTVLFNFFKLYWYIYVQ